MTSIGEKQQLRLLPVDQFPGSVLIQGSEQPVLRDDWPQGIDYLCGHCQNMVIIASAADDQVWDVAFECFECKGLSASPSLPTGMVLPNVSLLFPKGRYMLSDSVDLSRVAIAGEKAHERSRRETGDRGSTFGYQQGNSTHREISPALLQSYINDLRSLLGPTYDKLYSSACRTRNSRTPPKNSHGLMSIVRSLEESIASFETPSPVIDARAVTEVDALLLILKRWRHHPYWRRMVGALDAEYQHTIITMAAASFLVDAGNGVRLLETSSARTPDLQLVTAPQQRAALEIKAPQALHSRTVELTPAEANRIITSAVKKAKTGKKGQLARKQPGLLVIGGFALSDAELDLLSKAATEYLQNATTRGRHSHIIAVSVMSVGTLLEATLEGPQPPEISISGTLSVRVAQNPGYKGDISLGEQPQSSLNRIENGQ
jgi:hypothetical protein